MVKPLSITRYECAICKTVYDTEKQATACEGRAVQQDKGVKVGDRVLVTSGDGTGEFATVESTHIISRDWGHYAWERYWHTVAVTGKLRLGHRYLTFDSYEVVKP